MLRLFFRSTVGPRDPEARMQKSWSTVQVPVPAKRYQLNPTGNIRLRDQPKAARIARRQSLSSDILRSCPQDRQHPSRGTRARRCADGAGKKEGLTRLKISRLPALLAVTNKQLAEASPAERARAVEDSIRTQVSSIRNLRDRVLLSAGLNLDQEPDISFENRINKAATSRSARRALTSSSQWAQGRFRYVLIVDLALRLLAVPDLRRARSAIRRSRHGTRFLRSHQETRPSGSQRLATESGENASAGRLGGFFARLPT